jgi:hypothetical protein
MFQSKLSCNEGTRACASAIHSIWRSPVQKQGEGHALLRQEEDKLTRKPDLLTEISQAKIKADSQGYILPEEVSTRALEKDDAVPFRV